MGTKEEVLDYVMKSPANSNRAVLEGMLGSGSEDGSSVEVINFNSTNYGTTYISDLTFAEIKQKIVDGKCVIARLVVAPDNPMGISSAAVFYKAPYTLGFVDISQADSPRFQINGRNNEDGKEWAQQS